MLTSVLRSLKLEIGEDPEYDKVIASYKAGGWGDGDDAIKAATKNMRIVPVNFGKYHREMLSHCKMILDDNRIAINPKFDQLITSLRTAVDNDGALDKELTSYNDQLDALRLALRFYEFKEAD